MQQPMLHNRSPNIDAIGQNKGPLKLPRSDAAVQINPLAGLLALPAQDHQLPVLHSDCEVVFRKTSHGQCDAVRVF